MFFASLTSSFLNTIDMEIRLIYDIYFILGCTGVVDVVIMLSSSDVVHRERFQLLQDFASRIVNGLDISETRTRVSVVYWAATVKEAFFLNKYYNKHDIKEAIRLKSEFLGGKSDMAEAFKFVRNTVFSPQNGDRANAQNILILIANGPSTLKEAETVPEAINLRLDGTIIVPIALENHMNNSIELWSIASNPKLSHYLHIDHFRNIPDKVEEVFRTICDGEHFK